MNILLTGATGFIGRHILTALQTDGHNVIASVRNPEKLKVCFAQTQFIQADFSSVKSAEDWLPYLIDIDVVINSVGIISENIEQSFAQLHSLAPIALFEAAKQQGIKRIVQISALGADETAQSSYHLSKKQADDCLRQFNLDWFVLKPSIVYGDGAQSMALFHALAALPILIALDGGQQKIQPVHIDDLVDTVRQCLKPEIAGKQSLDIVGFKAETWINLLTLLRARMGRKPTKIINIPGKIVAKTAVLGKCLGEPMMSPENITMLQKGNTADSNPIQQFIGRNTASLQEKLLNKPATQAERWHAQLYFIRPVLRLTIAFVWLWSGIVSLFFYPHEQSYQMLSSAGITGFVAPVLLYGLAVMDIALGLATLLAVKLRSVLLAQITIILSYTLFISFTLPEFWLHPFGPIVKNIPLLVSTLTYLILEEEKA